MIHKEKSCWIFLYELYYDARIHERQILNEYKDRSEVNKNRRTNLKM